MNKSQTGGATGDFSFFLPITKIDKERRLISGYASTPALDLDGEIVALDAVRKALPGYWQWRNIRRMHTADAVGVAKEANVDDKGLFLTSKIVDDDCWKKVLEGVYKGYSIGGKKLAKNGNTITEIELVEVSVVDRPANPECKFDVHKKAEDGAGAFLAKLPKSFRDPRDRALGQMAKAVQTLAKKDSGSAIVEPGPSEFLKTVTGPADGFQAPAKSAVTKTSESALSPLCKHGGDPDTCEKCMKRAAKKIKKREVGAKERKNLAGQGNALPDGSFRIKNKSDLANARQAVGRSKNPSAARALIRRRAKELGVELPPNWSKKFAKALIAEAEFKKSGLALSSEPSFLSLSKRMSTAASLAYCFDSLRDAQRNLLMEAKREGGDKKDLGLAKDLGSIAQRLAAVIGQKADHEGQEALDLSDADDQGFLDLAGGLEMSGKSAKTVTYDEEGLDPIAKAVLDVVKRASAPSRSARMTMARGDLKKAKKAAKDVEDAIKAAHAMHKAAYLSKAAGGKKKPADDGDADDFDHQGAMEKLQKAYGALTTVKTMMKAAGGQLKKAASRSGQRGQEVSDGNSDYQVPAGVKDLTPADMDTAGGSSPPFVHGMETPFPGKSAKVKKGGMISTDHAEALARAAAAEAQVEILAKQPGTPVFGKRPAVFDMTKIVGGTNDEAVAIMKGVDPTDLTRDETSNAKAVSRMIGNMIVGGHGKSVLDSTFSGTVGG